MLLRLQNSFASMTRLGREQERTANNLANANTIGFKRDRTFVETMNQGIDGEGAPRSEKVTEQWADLTAGSLEATNSPLDLAITGRGFFVVSDADGTQHYTRAGQFTTDANGMLRDPSGRLVMGESGAIAMPPSGEEISISANGEIRVGDQQVARLQIVDFQDPMQLVRTDGAAFLAGDQVPQEATDPGILQGHLETSNVDAIHAMTEMIQHFRLYESHQKVLQTTDQVLSGVTRDLGRF